MTLIELMLALVISSILMLGVSLVYVSSKRGYNLQDNQARQQENVRFSLQMLTHGLRTAGYPGPKIQEPIYTKVTSDGFGTQDGGGTNSDRITIQYESSTDCLGQALTVGANACTDDGSQSCAVNEYYVANDPNNNNLPSLWCLGNGNATPQVVAEGVSNMQVLYGIDTNSDGVPDQYVTWTNAAGNYANIVSVRFSLLAQTSSTVFKNKIGTKSFALLDQTITPNDKYLYRVYTDTVMLRNRLPNVKPGS